MKYDFDKPINRQGTHCVKWDMAPHYPQTPTPNPSRGEGSLDTLSHQAIATEANQAPLPSGDWGLQSSHRCGCGPTKGSESLIRDGGQDGGGFIPLWVADMDFEAAPAIREALQKRVEHGVFGYAIVQDSYYDAVINWYERRHQWHIEREWIQYTTGVVPAISAVIKALTMPGERVLIMTPVYNCFFSSIRNNGCEVLESKLVPVEAKSPQIPTPNLPSVANEGFAPLCGAAATPVAALKAPVARGEGGLNTLSSDDATSNAIQAPLPSGGGGGGYQSGSLLTYSVDWDDFERKCADEKCTVFLLCNPHNPAGRVWTREELQRMNDICQRHHVRIISDEIHCELTMPGYEFVPMGRLTPLPLSESEGSKYPQGDDPQAEMHSTPLPLREGQGGGSPIICCSPSKSFNTAGLQMANIICADAETRRRIDRAININEICDVNPFAPLAVEAAYNESEDWIDELNQYLWGNYQALLAFFAEQLPQLKVFKLEGTYLVWVDITALRVSADEIEEKLLREARVWVNSGTMYGADGYIRINIATQRARLMEGLRRMARVI